MRCNPFVSQCDGALNTYSNFGVYLLIFLIFVLIILVGWLMSKNINKGEHSFQHDEAEQAEE